MATSIVAAALFMAVLGILLAIVLATAGRFLHVQEDPRIDEVEEMLPHANCGACGLPGCRPFAEAVVKGDANPAGCTVSTADQVRMIADFLGVDISAGAKRIARLACAGGSHVARMRAVYAGLETCRAAAAAGGGGKACDWGCLGLGDCAAVCAFDAIHMNPFELPEVIDDRCVACNDCVEVCPRDLFSLEPVSHRLWVTCKSLAEGDQALEDCEVACTGCARCAADAPAGLIRIIDNLATVDYSRNEVASRNAIQRCPTGAIVWLEGGRAVKGAAAKKIVRKEPLPIQDEIRV